MMALQHVEDRIERADAYMQEASFSRGVARSLHDLAEHINAFKPGSDPAREAMRLASKELRGMGDQTTEYADRLEKRADLLRSMVVTS